mgnify:CR=1 FL=1
MRTPSYRTTARAGLTLVEVLMAIVLMGVGIAGVLLGILWEKVLRDGRGAGWKSLNFTRV